MAIGLVGRKCGMSRVFTEDGAIPVTVIEVLPNRVTRIKTKATDDYSAIQITTGAQKLSRLTKAEAGEFAKAAVEPGRGLWEFAVDNDKELEGLTIGMALMVDLFVVGQFVDVSGITKGKGFAGTIKRHHFASQDATHGNSVSHRTPGSIGQRQTPGRVFKGKKMCGHLGQDKRTVLSQKVVALYPGKNLLLVKGAIPGAPGMDVIIRSAIKKPMKKEQLEGGK